MTSIINCTHAVLGNSNISFRESKQLVYWNDVNKVCKLKVRGFDVNACNFNKLVKS